ncbi:metallophosphoesterase [Hydrogenovibrio halophilus]|uniref:metallophosphoesterase n=1 Tax=Hydrogenovibrio halophilus TaxID=373391 RepID=UPI0003813CF1|nr:metallophosphoesterase [Hydrogenovibrio halophilus]
MPSANALNTETWHPTLAEPSRPCHQWMQALAADERPQWGISGDQWLSPNQDTYFFCDLHADADAFLRSLKLSGLVTRDSILSDLALTSAGQRSQIIIGGDCFDKGPSNLELLSLIGHLYRIHADVVLLAGNHDMRVYAGLMALDVMDDLRQAHFFIRMGRKTVPLFAEIYAYGQQHLNETLSPMTEAQIKQALLPPPEWFEFFPAWAQGFMPKAKIQKELKRVKQKQIEFFQACGEAGLSLRQLYQATLWAKETLLKPDGAFGWFLQSLDLLHINGSYCFSHAGLDDQMAMRLQVQTPEQINRHFRQQLFEGRIFQLYYSALGNTFRTKYRAGDYPLTPRGVRMLKERRIYAMVNGHRSHPNGQQLFVREGLLNFECDTQLNANCRRKKQRHNPGEAVTIFHSDGRVQGLSADYPAIKQFHPDHLNPDVS